MVYQHHRRWPLDTSRNLFKLSIVEVAPAAYVKEGRRWDVNHEWIFFGGEKSRKVGRREFTSEWPNLKK